MYELILASQSPRRSDLLTQAGFIFQVLTVEISENLNENLSLDDAIRALAEDKSRAWLDAYNYLKSQHKLVLTADTVVVAHGQVLGKPQNAAQAADFLRLLSGRWHQVKTAVCLVALDVGVSVSKLATTEVQFRSLTEQDIEQYVSLEEGMGKAGGYAIQGSAQKFVASLRGELDNVIGLPVSLLERMLEDNGWQVYRRTTQYSKA